MAAGNSWLEERFRGVDHRIDAIEGDQEEIRKAGRETRGIADALKEAIIRADEQRKANGRLLWWIFTLVGASVLGQVLSAWAHFPR